MRFCHDDGDVACCAEAEDLKVAREPSEFPFEAFPVDLLVVVVREADECPFVVA